MSIPPLPLLNRATVHDEVIAKIRQHIQNGQFLPGARLPSERELAEQFQVSRAAVREGVRALMNMGVLETRHGSGTVVSSSGDRLFGASFEYLLMLEKPSLEEIYEARELIEVFLAGRAAEKRTSQDLNQLHFALEQMRDAIAHPPSMTGPNIAFHNALAEAAHQPVLQRIVVSMHDGIRSCIETTATGVEDWNATFDVHERIYLAIKAKKPREARAAMTDHMSLARQDLGIAKAKREK